MICIVKFLSFCTVSSRSSFPPMLRDIVGPSYKESFWGEREREREREREEKYNNKKADTEYAVRTADHIVTQAKELVFGQAVTGELIQ